MEEMLRKNEEDCKPGAVSDDSFDRDETELNQQDSEPTPTALSFFGKQKSTNLVTPYNPSSIELEEKPKKSKGSRYVFKEEEDDFSRDVTGGEDIGIGGAEEDFDGVLFDEQDLYGDKKEVNALKKSNRSKMLMDELEGGLATIGAGPVADTE